MPTPSRIPPIPISRRTLLTALVALLGSSLIALAGCGDSPDRKAIRESWKRYYAAVQQARGLDYYDLISSGTTEFYERIVPLAAKGAKAEISALAPAEKRELLLIRNRVPAAKLKTMTGRQFVVHAISERYWADHEAEFDPNDEDGPWKAAKILINGNTAVAEYVVSITMPEEPRFGRRRYRAPIVEKGQMYFVKENGAWRIDEVAQLPGINKTLKELAAGMTMERYLIDAESDETGQPVAEDIFDKPPR